MREIDITEECLEFIDNQSERVSLKFFQLIEVIGAVCLCGLLKKSTKDYKKAVKQAEKILEEYLKEK